MQLIFQVCHGYESLDSIDMNNPYLIADLIQNDFIQDIGIPRDMRNIVQNAEMTRYKEMPTVRDAMDVINESAMKIKLSRDLNNNRNR